MMPPPSHLWYVEPLWTWAFGMHSDLGRKHLLCIWGTLHPVVVATGSAVLTRPCRAGDRQSIFFASMGPQPMSAVMSAKCI